MEREGGREGGRERGRGAREGERGIKMQKKFNIKLA